MENKWTYMCSVFRNYPESEMMILEVIIYNDFFLFLFFGLQQIYSIL